MSIHSKKWNKNVKDRETYFVKCKRSMRPSEGGWSCDWTCSVITVYSGGSRRPGRYPQTLTPSFFFFFFFSHAVWTHMCGTCCYLMALIQESSGCDLLGCSVILHECQPAALCFFCLNLSCKTCRTRRDNVGVICVNYFISDLTQHCLSAWECYTTVAARVYVCVFVHISADRVRVGVCACMWECTC